MMLSLSFTLKAQVLSGNQGKTVGPKNAIVNEKGSMLWNQNVSAAQGYGAYSTFFGGNAAGHQRTISADDFVVPVGKQWITDTVNVTFFDLKGIADNYHIYIYGESAGKPNVSDVKFHDFYTVGGIQVGYWYDVKFPLAVTLPAGNYWICFYGNQAAASVTNPGVFPGVTYTAASFWLKCDTTQDGMRGNSAFLSADSAGVVTASYPCFFSWFYYDVAKQYPNLRFQIKGTETNNIESNNLSFVNGIISAYPIPANNTITFKTSSKEGNAIEIYNSIGEKINTVNLNGKNTIDVDISSYSNGIYFYEFKSKTAVLETGRFVKE